MHSDQGSSPPYRSTTGFSAAGADFRDDRLSLDRLIIRNPAATFFLRAEAASDLGGSIQAGDILVVDRAARPGSGSLVVAVVDGELVLRLLARRAGRLVLRANRSDNESPDTAEARIWGKVTYVLHPVSP
jgi:DNA polymerase V